MYFALLKNPREVETIASGGGIRELKRLRRLYGGRRWRKRKGVARVRLRDGSEPVAELHWYEAHGLGRYEYKIKSFLESGAAPSRPSTLGPGFSSSVWRTRATKPRSKRRKFYVALPNAEAEQHRLVRVVDESGEDYLFPASYFAAPELTPTLRKRLLAAV